MIVVLSTLALALPAPTSTWEPLAKSPVAIECTDTPAGPYCRSTGVVSVPVDTAVQTFRALDAHVAKMASITKIARLEPDVLHVVMDYPFPTTDRDYVARFTETTEADGTVAFTWTPTTHPKAPDNGQTIRLGRLDGQWRFAADGSNTRVTYVWHADPGGSLPDVGVVRKKAGLFAITDIASATGGRIVSP